MNARFSAGATAGSWKTWQNEPLEIDLTLQVTDLNASLASSFFVKLNDATISALGQGCSTPTNLNTGVTRLKPYKQYTLTAGATNLDSFTLTLSTRSPDSILPGKLMTSALGPVRHPGTLPAEYDIFINGERVYEFSEYPGSCGAYGTNWTVELRKALDSTFRKDDDSNGPDSAPGDGQSIEIGPGNGSVADKNSWSWSVSLGHLYNGNRAGKLNLSESGFSSTSFKPESLFYSAKSDNVRNQIKVVKTNASIAELRQLIAPQAFVDIFPGTNQYWIRFFHPNNVGTQTNNFGVYTNFSGNPYVTWWVLNPNGAGTYTKVQIIEQRNGINRTNELSYTSGTKVWLNKTGTGNEQRVETRTISLTGTPVDTRLETVEVKNGAGTTAYKSTEKYEDFGYAWLLTQQVDDPSGSALTTTFTYYDLFDAPENAGRLKYITYPDGYWEARDHWPLTRPPELARKLSAVWKPWMDAPPTPASASKDDSFVTEHYYDGYGVNIVSHGIGYYSTSPEYKISHGEVMLHEPDLRPISLDPNAPSVWFQFNLEERAALDGDGNGEWIEKLSFWDTSPKYLADLPMYMGPAVDQPGFPDDRPIRDRPAQHSTYDFGSYNTNTYVFTVNTNGFSAIETNALEFRKTTVFSFTVNNNPAVGQTADAPGEAITSIDNHPVILPYSFQSFYASTNQTWKETTVLRRGAPILTEKYVCVGITNGLVITGFTNREPVFELVERFVYTTDLLGHVTNVTRIDPVTSAARTTFSADYKGGASVDADLKLSEMDEFGTQTIYAYDSLKRVTSLTKKGASTSGYPTQADIVTSYTYDAKDRKLTETRTGSALSLNQAWVYDVAGRLTSSRDEAAQLTGYAYSYPAGTGKVVTKTLPGGATEIESYYLDRRLKSTTGTGKVNEFHSYELRGGDIVGSGFYLGDGSVYDKVVYGTSTSRRWVQNASEGPYRPTTQTKPGLTSSNTLVWASNVWFTSKLMKGHDLQSAELNTANTNGTHYEYDYFGRQARVWMDEDSPTNGLAKDSMDRLMETTFFFRKISGSWHEVSTNYIYRTDNTDSATFAGATLKRLNGFNATTVTETTEVDVDNNSHVTTVTLDRANKKLTETLNPANSSLNAVRVSVNGLLQTETTPSVSGTLQHRYDALARETQTINPLGFSIYQNIGSDGRVSSTTDFAGNTTSYTYYPTNHLNAGRLKSEIRADGKATYYEYTSRGELYRKWGDVPYPEQRAYSSFGDLTELRTYRSGSGWNSSTWPGSPPTADLTQWKYDEDSGLVTNKTDHLNRSVLYYYTNSQLSVKLLARGIGVTNVYNSLGELVQTVYPANTPPVSYTYNRAGQVASVSDGVGANRTLSYDAAGRVVTSEDGVGYAYDGLNGLSEVTVSGQKHAFKYDTYGRLSIISNGTFSANYAYLANSDRLQTTTFKTNATTALTTSRGWDFGERVRSIQNSASGVTMASFDYLYDNVNRRVLATLEDGSSWRYGYNDRDELISAKRTWNDFTPVPGQGFEYGYDPIGNRLSFKQGGDAQGQNLRWTTNDFNALNQLVTHKFPGALDVIGAVEMTSSNVTVNSQAAYRRGEYLQKDVYFNNTNTPLYATATVSATYNGSSTTTNGSILLAATPETITYDLDGNLKSDGIWTYTWDAENRLIGMTNTVSGGGLPNAEKKLLVFTYDHMGRRRTKTVSTWNGSAFASPVTTQFVYDGWRLLAEKDGGGSLVRSYVWGSDLSGDRDSAGGVGGLVMVIEHSPTLAVHFPMYDGNGNVVGLIRSSATLSARYETGPFGESIRATGPVARTNPVRFSSKFVDEESGLSYYGYRFYSPRHGRWLSRDPIGERGGMNLYGFTRNAPVFLVDADGRIIPVLVGIGVATAIGAIYGALTNPDDPMYGALKGGATAGIGASIGVFASAGLVAGAGMAGIELSALVPVVMGGAVAAGSAQALGYAADNYVGGNGNPFAFTTRQGLMTGLAAGTGAFTGGFLVGSWLRAGRSLDEIDELVLDAMISVAGTAGVAAGEMLGVGAESALGALSRISNNRDKQLEGAGSP